MPILSYEDVKPRNYVNTTPVGTVGGQELVLQDIVTAGLLGKLTSQFFANVYLNELDQFVKHELKAKYYLRYVDDFVILHRSKEKLEEYKAELGNFLQNGL